MSTGVTQAQNNFSVANELEAAKPKVWYLHRGNLIYVSVLF